MSAYPYPKGVFQRCLRHQCPVCLNGRLYAKLAETRRIHDLIFPLEFCPSCHFRFAREPGYYVGIITPLLPILSLGTGAIFAALAYFFSNGDVDTALISGAIGLGLGFILLFRTSIAIYVAIDHLVNRPADHTSL